MQTEQSILTQLRSDQTPFWYLYDGQTVTARNGETADMNESLQRLKGSLAELPPGTYRLKAANNKNKHNGAEWHDITIHPRTQTLPKMTGQSTNAYGIADHVLAKIQEDTERNFMFKQMYQKFMEFDKEWPEFKKQLEQLRKDFYEDKDGDGIPDFAETIGKVANAAESANAVKKVFTGTSLFGS
ncbi:hypothetical protein [Spirosoma litoris]